MASCFALPPYCKHSQSGLSAYLLVFGIRQMPANMRASTQFMYTWLIAFS